MAAPPVVAKGKGFIARKIVERAIETDAPIVEDATLVSALISLELGEEIPSELYEAKTWPESVFLWAKAVRKVP